MARYKNISVDIWNNEDFRTLSDQAKTVYFYLATNPNNTSIPGLYRLSEMQAADDLRLDPERKLFESFSKAFDKDFNESFLKAFREAFDECFRKGFVKADWRNRVVWIPGLLSTNIPDTANVARSWAKSIPEIPDCQLKDEALHELILFIESFSKAFHEAFQKALSKALGKHFEITKTKTTTKKTTKTKKEEFSENNHENLGVGKDHSPDGESSNVEVGFQVMTTNQEIYEEYREWYRKYYGRYPDEWVGKDWTAATTILKKCKTVDEVKRRIALFFAWNNKDVIKAGHLWSDGYSSFICKIGELKADILKPERREEAEIGQKQQKERVKRISKQTESDDMVEGVREELRSMGHKID